jgi:hypothetical protein
MAGRIESRWPRAGKPLGRERAAEDARSAALEAMSYAAEARNPALQANDNGASQVLLDRLEADYQLITELIQGLHARIADLSRPAVSVEASVSPAPFETEQPPIQNADYWTTQPGAASAPPMVAEGAESLDLAGWRATNAATRPRHRGAMESGPSAAQADEQHVGG